MYELGDVEPVCTDLNLLGGMCRGKFSVISLVLRVIFFTEHCSGSDCNIGYIGDVLPEETTTQTTAQPTMQTSPQPTTRTTPTTTSTRTSSTTAMSTEPMTEAPSTVTTGTTSTMAPTPSSTAPTTTSTSTLPTNPTPVPDEPVSDDAYLIFYCIELLFLTILIL